MSVANTLLALNLWIDKYDLIIEGVAPALYVKVALRNKDVMKMGRIKVTDSISEILEALLIPEDEINYVLSTDTSVHLNQKMFGLFSKSPLFKPNIIRRSSFKDAHRYPPICLQYIKYVLETFGSDCDDDDGADPYEAGLLVLVQRIKEKYPRVKKQFHRLREQGVFYDTVYGVLSPEERSDEHMRRLFDIFVRLYGMRTITSITLGEELVAEWESFKKRDSTSAEDWQCLFI